MAIVKNRRWQEQVLLMWAGLFLLTGGLILFLLHRSDGPQIFLGGALAWVGFLALSVIFSLTGMRFNQCLLPVTAMLCFCSLVFLYRLQPAYAFRQLVWLFAGLAALLVTVAMRRYYRQMADYMYVIALLGTVFLLLPIFFGIEQGGNKSWLDFRYFQVQPSEFVKILLVVFLAAFLSENRLAEARGRERWITRVGMADLRDLAPLLAMWAVSLLLLIFQKDLGTALIYYVTFLSMVYVATSRILYVLSGILLFLAGGVVSYYLFGHVQQRVEIWLLDLDGLANISDALYQKAYQVLQGLYAMAAGGVTGVGLGAGQPGYIPFVHTDFIFAAIVEEMGLAGGLGILTLYLCYIYTGLTIALKARDSYSSLLAAGLTALMGWQCLIIIGGVSKVLPLTGVTLPFMSYGGSSLVANFIITGLLLNISHEAVEG
ncbi:FtsW/RodA/SpoVE family cell cycle protein [Desulfurispora thermophila]|uniref:FtsW/RodA/SpoVE family cell cycle protein n=1 Tax=Desulfurispora thermophila TaxID=265470 RepID=UPI00036A9F88|nr:FtsW/RodA/SpoVE family cell cycle protein [Desulfurispora thermophila]